MFYREIAPQGNLRKVIECFWMLEHDYRASFHCHEHLWAMSNSYKTLPRKSSNVAPQTEDECG